jgi:hypothetical protein
MCRYVSFMAYVSLQSSAWILAFICVDRYLILTNINWKRKISKSMKHTLLFLSILFMIIGGLNFPILFLNGEEKLVAINESIDINSTSTNFINYVSEIQCYNTNYMHFWQQTILYNECLIPLAIMIIFNSLLIVKTNTSYAKLKHLQKQRRKETLLRCKNQFSLELIRDRNLATYENVSTTAINRSSSPNAISFAPFDKIFDRLMQENSHSIAGQMKFYSSPNLCASNTILNSADSVTPPKGQLFFSWCLFDFHKKYAGHIQCWVHSKNSNVKITPFGLCSEYLLFMQLG